MIHEGFSKTVIHDHAEKLGGKSEIVGYIVNEDGVPIHEMRPNQRDLFEPYKDSKRLLIIQPPGSGKSAAIMFIMIYRIALMLDHKVIIAVPQTFISKSFGKTILKFDDGSMLLWDIHHDLCNTSIMKKTDAIIKFLKKKHFTKNHNERVLITTHYALVKAFSKLKSMDNSIFDDTTIVIDEAHHILNDGNSESNKIGDMIKVVNGNETCRFCFATATPFRGDTYEIIPKDEMDKFDIHFLPLDEHWEKNIQFIESFKFSFAIYKQGEVFDDIRKIIKNKKKSIIFCPFVGHLLDGKNKHDFKKRLINAIKMEWPECNILDLIETHKRREEKAKILNNKEAKEIDIILTLKIFDEGSDWIYAEQCLDLTPSNSMRIMYQRFGRLWRDLFGKINIEYFCFLPYEADFKDDEERRRHLSNSYNAFVISLLFQEMIQPFKYPKTLKGRPTNPFEEAGLDEAEQQAIMSDVIEKLLIMASHDEDPTKEEIHDWISSVLDGHDVIINKENIIKHVARVLRRHHETRPPRIPKNPNFNTADISWMLDAGFDEIWKNDILKDLLIFGTKTCGVKHFGDFRRVYNEERSVDEWVKIAEILAKNNNGIPPSMWLKTHNYSGLSRSLWMYPEKFAHIPRQYTFNSPDEWVLIADQLVNIHGGLPTQTWLTEHGYSGLCAALRKYPEKFKHIKKLSNRKTIDVHVIDAQNLAKKLGNLPSRHWLRHHGYGPLSNALYSYPERFMHIDKKRITKSVEEHLISAKQLADKHGGKLPGQQWMKDNGFKDLERIIRLYPTKFSHIMIRRKKIDYYIMEASELVKKCGKLPTQRWMEENGYYGLKMALYRHPEKFNHLRGESNAESKSKLCHQFNVGCEAENRI